MYAVGMLTLVFFIFHTFVISGKLTLNLNWNIMGCQVVFFLFESVRFHCIVWALGGSFSVIVYVWLHVSCNFFFSTINLNNYWKDIWYLELDNWLYTHKVFTYQFQTWDKKNQIFSQFNIYPVFKIKNQQAFIKCILQQFTYFFRPEQEQDKNKEQPEVSQSAGWCHQSTQQTGSDTSRGSVRDSHQGTELCQAADEEQPAGFRCHDRDGAISLRRCRYHCIKGDPHKPSILWL